MYKVIIADDEVWIGFGIKKLIHKSGQPFTVIGEAPNGIRAYEMVKKEQPDLLITDIRMPGLNGLELMRKLRAEENTVGVVFISGYAEFEYAREAISLGAFDYLLKPIEEESLTDEILRRKGAKDAAAHDGACDFESGGLRSENQEDHPGDRPELYGKALFGRAGRFDEFKHRSFEHADPPGDGAVLFRVCDGQTDGGCQEASLPGNSLRGRGGGAGGISRLFLLYKSV